MSKPIFSYVEISDSLISCALAEKIGAVTLFRGCILRQDFSLIYLGAVLPKVVTIHAESED